MDQLPPFTVEMWLVVGVMLLAIYLFAADVFRPDVTAIFIMTLIGLIASIPGLDGVIESHVLFSGFASNAVVSIIAVMILGRGLDKTGALDQLAKVILRYGGRTEARVVTASSGTVAIMSALMQNIGAAALFLPVIARISAQTRLPMSRLLMPMGFCAILGGTLTMIGSSPLIMLNDLIEAANQSQPMDAQIRTFALFDVTPVGVALVLCGMAYFLTFGRNLMPSHTTSTLFRGAGTVRYMRRLHGVEAAIREVEVPEDSSLVGREIDSLHLEFEVRVVATKHGGKVTVAPNVFTKITANATLAIIAPPHRFHQFVEAGGLIVRPKLKDFRHLLARAIAGVAEVIVPPDSSLIGKSVRDARVRAVYGLSLLSVIRADEIIHDELYKHTFQAGDTLICHTRWEDLERLENDRDFVVVTANFPKEQRDPYKVALALSLFLLSISLVIFTGISLPVALFVGAIGMIVLNVLSIDEAYRAVSWQTVFLLAGLLPLGHAVATTGVADFIAQATIVLLDTPPHWVLQTALAILTTFLTLLISNVGASVILVPIAISAAIAIGASPSMFALTVAVAASNSFVLPTHQVNALIMSAGAYRVGDFLRVGGAMTAIFIVVLIFSLNLVF